MRQVVGDAVAENLEQRRVVFERRARGRGRDHPAEQRREVHRNGGLLPVVVKLQVGGRENLGRGARLDALAACGHKSKSKSVSFHGSRLVKRGHTERDAEPPEEGGRTEGRNHIERAYRAPGRPRSIRPSIERADAAVVDRVRDDDATGWNETHRANAMPNARSRRSRVFSDAVERIERIERIAIRDATAWVEPFRELAGLTSYDSSKTERYPESPDGVATRNPFRSRRDRDDATRPRRPR